MEINWQKYQRQIILNGFGLNGQQKLAEAKILLIGIGGLGCPALLYLASAGVRHLTIVDFDKVELSNLPRQILFTENELNQDKVSVAAQKISSAFPEIHVNPISQKLVHHNAKELIQWADVVIDASDNFETRYLIDDTCKLLNKPWVYGSVSRYEMQVSVFNVSLNGKPKVCYRDLFPIEPKSGVIENCAEAGVIGALAGLTACFQVMEVIKLVCGLGEVLAGTLMSYDSLQNRFYQSEYRLNTEGNKHPSRELEILRNKLNETDQKIIDLLLYRKNIVAALAQHKRTLNLDIHQPEIWKNNLNKRLAEARSLGLNPQFIEELFELVHQQSIHDQKLNHGDSY